MRRDLKRSSSRCRFSLFLICRLSEEKARLGKLVLGRGQAKRAPAQDPAES